jgi:hypothetical protein
MNSFTCGLPMKVGCAALLILCGAPARAGYWDNASGTAPSGHFTWDSGQDLNGIFGNPTVTADDRFVFEPTAIAVSAHNGHAIDSLAESVSFNIHVVPGYHLLGFEILAHGDFLVQGAGSQADLSTTISLTELEGQLPQSGPRTFEDTLVTAPVTFPLTCTGPTLQGSWSGVSTLLVCNMLPLADSDLNVAFANLLNAVAAQDGSASLNLNFQQVRLEFRLLPEPASLLLSGLGAIALLRRRRGR